MSVVTRVAMAVAAGVLLLASAVSAQSAPSAAAAGDLMPYLERLGFPALAFFLMWRLVTQELRRNAEANERVAAALASLAAEVAAMREHARR